MAQGLYNLYQKDRLRSIVASGTERIRERWNDVHDKNVNLLFLKSGYAVQGIDPRIKQMEMEENYVKSEEWFWKQLHTVFDTIKFLQGRDIKIVLYLFAPGIGQELALGEKGTPLIQNASTRKPWDVERRVFFLEYIEFTLPLEVKGEALGYVGVM